MRENPRRRGCLGTSSRSAPQGRRCSLQRRNWLASNAATATLTIAMNAVAPPAAAAAFVATTGIALTNAGFNIQNIYKTGRDVYDIAKHEDDSNYLEHHGIKGQRWGVRRFQDESGALTGLGKQRANLDADWHPPKKV